MQNKLRTMKKISLLTASICILSFFYGCYPEDNVSTDSNQTDSQVGSYSTMLTIGVNLYLVNESSIATYDVSNASQPVLLNSQEVGFDIESIYHHKGLLLIGSAASMFIYSLNEKGIPVREGSEDYFEPFDDTQCFFDPIVARENLAYVTLSTDLVQCGWRFGIDELRVYDISDFNNVDHLSTFGLSNPKGLALGKEKLFVCDALDGLYVFDLSNPERPEFEQLFDGFSAFDALVRGNLLIVVASDRLLQYDISDEENIRLISEFKLK